MAGNKLFSKFLSFSFGSWVALGIGVISTPIITRLFSPKDFGLGSMYVLFFNIIVLVSLLGTDQAFVRFFYVEEENHRAVLLKKCIRMTIVAFILSSIVILFFSKPLSLFMFNQDSTFLILLVLLGALFQIIYRFSTLVIRMEQKGLIYSIVQIAAKILELLGVLLFVFLLGSSFHTYIYSYLFWLVIAALLTVFLTRHYWFSNRQKTTLKTTDKEIIYFSIPLVFTSLIYWLMQSIDRFALKAWASAEELGLYVAAFKVIALLNIFQTTFSTFWSPVSYDHYEKNPNDKVFYTKMYEIVSFGMFLIAILTIMFKDLIVLLLGAEYRTATFIMPFLVFMPVMYTISETTVIGINFYKKTRWHLFITIIVFFVNLGMTFVLVPKMGATGAAIATGLSFIIFMFLRTLISKKYFNVDYKLYKFFFITILVALYALYNSFYSWSWLNVLLGALMIGSLSIFYRKTIKLVIKEKDKLFKKGEERG